MATDDDTNQYEEWDVEVAKRIACAVTSYQASVSFESLWEDYGRSREPVGTFWLSIAKRIREEMPKKSKWSKQVDPVLREKKTPIEESFCLPDEKPS